MITLKVIKTSIFEVDGQPAVNYVAAYKGNVFNVSSLSFEADDLILDAATKTLKIKCDVEVHKTPYVKDLTTGEIAMGFSLKEKMDLAVANWKN